MNRLARTVLVLGVLCTPGLAHAQFDNVPKYRTVQARCAVVNGQVNTVRAEMVVEYGVFGFHAYIFKDRASGQTYPFPGRPIGDVYYDFPLPAGRAYNLTILHTGTPTSTVGQAGWWQATAHNIIVPPVQIIGGKCIFATPVQVQDAGPPRGR